MHIAMVTDYYLPTLGGVQTAIKAAKESLEQLGHQVTVFCPLRHDSEAAGVVALPISKVFRPDGFPFTWPPRDATALLKEELAARKVDVVHVHSEVFAALAGIKAAQELGLPLVQSMHGRIDVYTAKVLPLPQLTTALLAALHRHHLPHTSLPAHPESPYMRTAVARRMWRLMLNQANAADAVIVPSEHLAKKFLHQGVVPPVHVVSNGLEDSVLELVGAPQLRSKSPDEPLQVMWCGRVSPEKRPEVFVRAVAAAGETVVASIYGDGVAGTRVRRLIRRLGVEHRITMHGGVPQRDVLEAMGRHHVFVSSSHDFDNQPMVILEAMASGLPVVLCDPDLAEGLPDGGFIVADSPQPGRIAAVLESLATDSDRIEAMSRAVAAGTARAAFCTHAEELVETYRQALATRSVR
ncbi:hypothetical protein ART_3047 [Arthrobacter sp. PAMC 25486]|uniref:glycosyltransferase n=1 Tax=Arthrobacter sp. PAMC 25486 TaxID=1494608 RepID=UPI00053640C9|nr:glycosyltransferase [Arthrobacter sp. PAMC 25486]AIY02646.1 hypothetical protein ART_3047 [Arthrobacter sp. PAMC 25486]